MTFAGEAALLLRQDARLLISDDDTFWTPDVAGLLPKPCELAILPVL